MLATASESLSIFFHFCSLGASIIFCHNPISVCWMLQQQCLTLRADGCLRVGLFYLRNTSEMCPLFILLVGKQFLMCSHTCKVEPRWDEQPIWEGKTVPEELKDSAFRSGTILQSTQENFWYFLLCRSRKGILEISIYEWLHDPWVHCWCRLCK